MIGTTSAALRGTTARSPFTKSGAAASVSGFAPVDCSGLDKRTFPEVTTTSIDAAARRTLNAVPTARTVTPPAVTRNGRASSCATSKCASPASSSTRRATEEYCTVASLLEFSVTVEPSGKSIFRNMPAAVA